jgi:hypothetical protein
MAGFFCLDCTIIECVKDAIYIFSYATLFRIMMITFME